MKDVQVSAEVPANPDKNIPEALEGSVVVKFAETLEEAKAAFGEEAILSNAFANWKITLQANIRNGLKRGETSEILQQRLGSAKMGVAAQGVRVDPIQLYVAQFKTATPEKQREMLAQLQAAASVK